MARGYHGLVHARPADVRSIYENPDQTVALMKKYNATLLYVGDVGEGDVQREPARNRTERVYSGQGTDIYRIAE